MYSFPDSSFQGILYKPNIQDNPNLDKNFIKKRKLLFCNLHFIQRVSQHQKTPSNQTIRRTPIQSFTLTLK